MASSTNSFVLSRSSLKLDTADSVTPHIAPLLENPASIIQIDLSGNTLGEPACAELAKVLPKLVNLQHANLADIFTGRLLSEIPPALSHLLNALLPLKGLRTLNLSDNAFGLNTQAPLAAHLSRATPLRHLILNNNGLGPEAGTLVAQALVKLAEAKSGTNDAEERAPLETIVCGRNRLENGSMAAWAKAVSAHAAGLKEVRMVQNGIRQEGIQLLLRQGFGSCSKLEVLDLQDNTFTRTGSKAMADVVDKWTNLRELGVGDCLVSSKGMILIGEALAGGKNTKLEVIRAQYDEINAAGVESIATACDKGSLPKLRRVEINGNKFAEEDPAVEKLRSILDKRREDAGESEGADEDERWGLDELDELEDDDDEDEDEEDEDEDGQEDGEGAKERERDVQQAKEAEEENVPQETDADVDALADKLGKTGI